MAPSQWDKYVVRPQAHAKRAILLKGASGTGKSFQYSCLRQAGISGLYVSVNEHNATVHDWLVKDGFWQIKRIDVPLSPMDNLAQSDFKELLAFIKSGEHEYEFVYFDSMMRLADGLVSYLRHDKRITGFDLWNIFAEKMKYALAAFTALTDPALPRPVHAIATWGVEVDRDWEGKRAHVALVDGKVIGPRIDYYFDDVFMLQKAGDDYVLHTAGTHDFNAKVSGGKRKLQSLIKSPDLANVLKDLAPKA